MMLLLVLCSLIEVLLAQKETYPIGSHTYCREYNLRTDEPMEVTLSHKSIIIYRSNGSISSITLSLLNDREELAISGSRISHVEGGVLCSAPNMKALYLTFNIEFPVLTESLLSNCGNIKTFRILGEEMEPNALKHMASLEELHIYQAKISHFTRQYLEALKELKEFSLSESEIETIDSGTLCSPPKLQKLILSENKQFPALTKPLFEGCNHIRRLEIPNYRTTFMNIAEDAFTDFTGLRYLEATNLIINQLTKQFFAGIVSLESLILRGCNITGIDADAFEDLRNLRRLELIGSNLRNEDLPKLARLTNLEELDLAVNDIESIDDLNFPKLKHLRVVGNSILKVDVNKVTSNLPNLERLFIYNNPMSCSDKKRLTEDMGRPGRFVMTVLDEKDLEKEDC